MAQDRSHDSSEKPDCSTCHDAQPPPSMTEWSDWQYFIFAFHSISVCFVLFLFPFMHALDLS
jgi:hypothetical protein